MAISSQTATKAGFGSLAVLMGALMIAAIVAIASIEGDLPWMIAIPLGIAALLFLKPKSSGEANPPIEVRPSAVFVGERLNGVNTLVEIRSDGLAITRQGPVGFLAYGLKGEKLLPFRSITSVQFKPPGGQMAGYIQFGIKGGIEARRGIIEASGDENTVLFAKDHHEKFLGLYQLVEKRISCESVTQGQPVNTADQLVSLSKLHDAGHLNDTEFASAKQKILST